MTRSSCHSLVVLVHGLAGLKTCDFQFASTTIALFTNVQNQLPQIEVLTTFSFQKVYFIIFTWRPQVTNFGTGTSTKWVSLSLDLHTNFQFSIQRTESE